MTDSHEPELVTAPHLAGILEELRRREPIFHRPESGDSRADHERMTAGDFWEIGASGQRYSRAYVLDVLDERRGQPVDESDWETGDFHCRELAPDLYLLTYTLRQADRLTRRSTIWRREAGTWKIVFHQGTVVQAA